MADRFFGQAAFKFRIIIELESNDWGTQGPTVEDAQRWARERAEKVVRRSARRGFPECDDVTVTEFTCIESKYDLGELTDECPNCAGTGKEAGRACGMCNGIGHAQPVVEVPGSSSADAPF